MGGACLSVIAYSLRSLLPPFPDPSVRPSPFVRPLPAFDALDIESVFGVSSCLLDARAAAVENADVAKWVKQKRASLAADGSVSHTDCASHTVAIGSVMSATITVVSCKESL